jgi:hypothetical protein
VIVRYCGRDCLIDGGKRTYAWRKAGDTGDHPVYIMTVQETSALSSTFGDTALFAYADAASSRFTSAFARISFFAAALSAVRVVGASSSRSASRSA